MNDIEKDVQGSGLDNFKVLSHYVHGWTEVNYDKLHDIRPLGQESNPESSEYETRRTKIFGITRRGHMKYNDPFWVQNGYVFLWAV
jgi:hypothetical protein